MLGLARRYGPAFFTANQLALVNGELGSYTPGFGPGADANRPMAPRIMAMTVRDRKVWAMWDIANPEKFTGSRCVAEPESQCVGGLGGGLGKAAPDPDEVEVGVRQVGLTAQYHRNSTGTQRVRVRLAVVADRVEAGGGDIGGRQTGDIAV